MVEKGNGVLILENAKTVIMASNLAKSAVRVKDADLGGHVWPAAIALQGERIRPARKTTNPSIWGCRGSSIRGLCARFRWYSPTRLYSWSPWRRPGDRQPSYRAYVRCRPRFRHSAHWMRCKARDSEQCPSPPGRA